MIKLLSALALLLISNTAAAHGVSEADQARLASAGNLEYLLMGAKHMLTGYDHILFLCGVMFFLTRFAGIVKVVTAFTIGHSITLLVATVYGLQANYYLVDAVIALTVCYKAFDNLNGFEKHLQMSPPNIVTMVFVFGLIHGFGLSTRLQQLPLNDDGLVLKILSFNLGVEIGQIAALSVILLALYMLRKLASFQRFSVIFNVALMAAGTLLLLSQLHGFQHSEYSDDFPLNKDDHYHTHQEMTLKESPKIDYQRRFNHTFSDESSDGESGILLEN